jgi:hypothetical protein
VSAGESTQIDFPITGGCNCGAIRFEVTGPFEGASYCHCTRCQRRTGTAAAPNARTAPGTFRIFEGEDRLRAWHPETGMDKYFCGHCGSALFSAPGRDFEQVGVRFGALDRDPGIRPGHRQYVAYAAAWEEIPDDGLPRYPEARPR